jgi:DNA invertase Pin-like site-specific DNA recombinase
VPRERKIKKLEAINTINASSSNAPKRRVAAYARVSTSHLEQQESYQAQCEYFTNLINSRPDWEFCGVYADEGLSGTSTKKRDRFNAMIEDALAGKFDLIVTKSISRFARNTVDTLSAIRKLKAHDVEIYFEKEGIYTLDSKGELFITILSSVAQEESRNLSENTAWGIRKRFADGKINLPYGRFLGFEKGSDGLPSIVEDEAIVVRYIFSSYIQKHGLNEIAKRLIALGIPTPGNRTIWQA